MQLTVQKVFKWSVTQEKHSVYPRTNQKKASRHCVANAINVTFQGTRNCASLKYNLLKIMLKKMATHLWSAFADEIVIVLFLE